MKIIFLDIDGVMNSKASTIEAHELGYKRPGERWGKWSVDILKEIIKITNAKIVISSTWRLSTKTLRAFHKNKLDLNLLVGDTPMLEGHRGSEIHRFLTSDVYELTDEIESFVILDDETDMSPYIDRLVKINYEMGLCEKHIPKICSILNEPINIRKDN